MSVTKDGFYNIEGKMFEVVHGVEGDCLTLGDEDGGTRISGPKPWGGGQVTKTFVTQEKYGPIERLEAENAKLRELLKNALTYIEYEGCGVEFPETGNSAALTPCDMCNHYETESCAYVIAQSARELKIEVDDE